MPHIDTLSEFDLDNPFAEETHKVSASIGAGELRKLVESARDRHLDMVGKAREELAAQSIDIDQLMSEFIAACRMPGLEVEFADSALLKKEFEGYIPICSAIEVSSSAAGTWQFVLSVGENAEKVRFHLLGGKLAKDRKRLEKIELEFLWAVNDFFVKTANLVGRMQASVIRGTRVDTERDGADSDFDAEIELPGIQSVANTNGELGYFRRLIRSLLPRIG